LSTSLRQPAPESCLPGLFYEFLKIVRRLSPVDAWQFWNILENNKPGQLGQLTGFYVNDINGLV
jgi:hypothetical protein